MSYPQQPHQDPYQQQPAWPAQQSPAWPAQPPVPQSPPPAYDPYTSPPVSAPYGYAQPQQAQYAPPPYQQQAPQQNVNVVQSVRMTTARQGTNHRLHFLITLFTCGMWAPVWFIVWLFGRG